MKRFSLSKIHFYLYDFRVFLIAFFVLLIPFLISSLFVYSKMQKNHSLRSQLEQIKNSSSKNGSLKNHFRWFCKEYKNADHFYLDKEVESLVFLKQEIEMLEHLLDHSAFMQSEAIQKRLNFLKNDNHLLFAEEMRRSSPKFYEVEETQLNPVEIGREDLKEILQKIEGASNKKPQLIIKDFEIQKKPLGIKGEIYSLHLSLLKREVQNGEN